MYTCIACFRRSVHAASALQLMLVLLAASAITVSTASVAGATGSLLELVRRLSVTETPRASPRRLLL
jgi:hypothetical protein